MTTTNTIFVKGDSEAIPYMYGDLTYTVTLDETGKSVEPYVLDFSVESEAFSPEEKDLRENHDWAEKIWYYPSKDMFVVFYDGHVTEVILMMTCWSDDSITYYIENDVVVSYKENYHGCNELKIEYKDGKVSNFSFRLYEFGVVPEIGEKALTLNELVPDLANDTTLVIISSFGYESNRGNLGDTKIFNVRNLPNPDKTLIDRGLTGLDKQLRDSLFSHEEAEEAYQEYKAEIIKAIESKIKSEEPLRFAFGCHKGKHRSVAFAERMRSELHDKKFDNTTVHVAVDHAFLRVTTKYTKDFKKKSTQKRGFIMGDDLE
jgi:hypothetical protein